MSMACSFLSVFYLAYCVEHIGVWVYDYIMPTVSEKTGNVILRNLLIVIWISVIIIFL